MSTTFAELKTSLRLLLTDKSIWSDSALDQWAKDAIQDYSAHFPMQVTASISVSAGVREYDLATCLGYISSILRVEFPMGEEPPVFLHRLAQDHTSFLGGIFYDLEGDPVSSLILGQTPSAGETIGLTYTSVHTRPVSDEVFLTVPDAALEALRLYVTWKAFLALELDNSIDIARKSQLIHENENSSNRAWKNYLSKILELHRRQARAGFTGPWSMDSNDRVY